MMFVEKLYLEKSKGISLFYAFIERCVASAFRGKREELLGKTECLS